jgi:hypothetical protein
MAKKKKTKRSGRKKTPTRRQKTLVRKRSVPRAKPKRSKKTAGKKAAPRKKTTRPSARRRSRGPADSPVPPRSTSRGLGAEAGGQSGDTEGLSRAELADSESVEELLAEGQAFEAGIVSGVENAPEAGSQKGGVRTRQVPEDDVPQEYLDED